MAIPVIVEVGVLVAAILRQTAAVAGSEIEIGRTWTDTVINDSCRISTGGWLSNCNCYSDGK